MTCHNCRIEAAKAGKHRNGLQRFRCSQCSKTFTEPHAEAFSVEHHLTESRGLLAVQLLLEGNSIRVAERISGLHRNTIMKLLVIAGSRCETMLARNVRSVPVQDVQCDEIWSYVGKKEGHKNPFKGDDMYVGDAWCFIAIERHSKLVLAFELGKRTEGSTNRFMAKLAIATSVEEVFQLSTDGSPAYPSAVYRNLGNRVDYAKVVKVYAQTAEGEARYSPPEVVQTIKTAVYGDPDMDRACTSHIERKNGSLRLWCKRLARLTYAFSKKWVVVPRCVG